MRRAFLPRRFPARLQHRGAGAAVDPIVAAKAGAPEPEVPTRPVPTIVNKLELFNYGADLAPLIKSFNDDDLLAKTVYKDPDAAYAAHDKLLFDASKLDGCTGPTDCPGWGTITSAPLPLGTSVDQNKAYQMRREAFTLYVDAAFMEERIKARGGNAAVSKAQIAAEVHMWEEWQAWLKSYKAVLQNFESATGLVNSDDFETMQRMDVVLQKFRNRYRTITKFEPTDKYLTPLVQPKDPDAIPWKPIAFVAVVGLGVYVLHEARLFTGLFTRPAAKAA